MKRRAFAKALGSIAATAATGSPLLLLGGCGGGGGGDGGIAEGLGQPPTARIAFAEKETLDSLREKIRQNGYRFTVERNAVYDFSGFPGTPALLPGVDPGLNSVAFPFSDALLGAAADTLPLRCDARDRGGRSFIGPIENQAESNNCWAFSTADVASVAHNVRNGLYDENCVVLSPLYLRYILRSGSDSDLGVFYGLTRAGNPAGYPTGREGACQAVDFPVASFGQGGPSPPKEVIDRATEAPRIYLRRCGRVYPARYPDTTAQIKAAILKYGAVQTSMKTNAAVCAYRSGVYEDTLTETDATPYFRSHANHAISLVGWDDAPPEGGGGCWILRNSWGTSWGEDGYMRIRYFSARVNCFGAFIEGLVPGESDLAISGALAIDGAGVDILDLVTLTLTGADSFAITPVSGEFCFQALDPGSYRVTPTLPGVAFSPPYRELTLAGKSFTGMEFAGRRNG